MDSLLEDRVYWILGLDKVWLGWEGYDDWGVEYLIWIRKDSIRIWDYCELSLDRYGRWIFYWKYMDFGIDYYLWVKKKLYTLILDNMRYV